MTNAENEMRSFLKYCTCLEELVFHDQMVIGKLNDKVNVKISFHGGIQADTRDRFLVEIINRESGKIDANTFHFSNIIGQYRLYNGDMTDYRLYKGLSKDFTWYTDRPTLTQRNEIMKVVYSYIKLFK